MFENEIISPSGVRLNPQTLLYLPLAECILMIMFPFLSVDLPKAWRLLGGNDLGTLAVRKLGTILRGFGRNPTEQEVDFLKYESGLDGRHTLWFSYFIWISYFSLGNSIDDV